MVAVWLVVGGGTGVHASPPHCRALPPAVAQALLDTTNAARRATGAPAVSWNASLARAAHNHACALSKTDTLAHTGTGGSGPYDRAKRAGFSGCRVVENIAAGQRTAQHVWEGWVRRPGHYRNIVDKNVQGVGFGATFAAPDGGMRWVMVLGGAC